MSKKIELSPNQISECLRLYKEELLGSSSISERMGFHKTIIIRTLKENGVVLGQSGRRNTGGKASANERYYLKNKEEISIWYKSWSKDNRALLRDKHTQWRDANREHINQYARDYQRKRCASDRS